MSKVASENQGLETTFLDLESADDDEFLDAIRENTKVSHFTHDILTFLTSFYH